MSQRISHQIASASGKTDFNEWMFSIAASKYDWATQVLSLGQDAGWKRQLMELLPYSDDEMTFLDLACGTGDVTLLVKEQYPKSVVQGIDISEHMLQRARTKPKAEGVTFAQADMCRLPVPSNSVDVVTGSYALRNAGNLNQALAEISRVLKPGGMGVFLDFHKPQSKLAQQAQYATLKFWGALWGIILHLNPSVHGYIADSLKQFPAGPELVDLFRSHGMELASDKTMLLDTIRLWTVRKL
jgi:ubiquinone/menaquinone biosynthesis methyltransferase